MPSVARRTREIAWTRDDILAAAERAFARTGFEATTMQDIAREAGYTVPSLYAYFEGKQELYDAVIARLEEEYEKVFDAPEPAGLTFRQRLELMLTRLFSLTEKRRCAIVILLASPARHGRRRLSAFDRTIGRWTRWLRRGAPADLGDVDDTATAIAGLVNAFFLRWMSRGGDGDLTARAPVIADLFLHGLGRRR